MDTEFDFITPEFLNVLFFQQKNLVIFPYVDLEHLRSLQVFAVGYDVVDIDSTVVHNLSDIIEFEAGSYSQQPTFYFVLNPKTKEIEELIKVNRKIGQKFIQLIHDYRFEKVNPANLEVPQLFYPKKLYNYLRNHHWEKGIPQEFVSEWVRATTVDFSLTEDDHMEFQMMLIKLDLPYFLPEFDAERESKAIAASPSRLKREAPTQIVRKGIDPKTVPSSEKKNKLVKKVKQAKQVGSDSIPPIENFLEFKGWMLKKLDELENL